MSEKHASVKTTLPHDGKFDFNVSSGAILNLFSRDYHYLHFPGADQVNSQFERLRQETATQCQAFKPPKNTAHYKDFRDGDARRDPLVLGDVLVSEDGGFKWRLYTFSLQSDLLRIKRPRKPKEYRKEILYSFKYRAPLLERLGEGFPVVTMVKLFFKNGNIFDVRCPKEEDSVAFHRSLKGLWESKYTSDEILERKKAVQALRELAVKSLKVSVKKFNLFARAFWNYSPPPLQRSGHANLLLSDGRVRPIFLELSSFSIVLLLPRTPGMEHRHVDTFLVLNVVQVVDDPDPTIFFIKTPFKSLKLQVPHNVAKRDWVSALSAILTGNEAPDPGQGPALPQSSTSQYPSKGYKYTAPLHGRLSIQHESSGRVWKLTGDGPWTIGRSRDNSICLSSDPYLSRHHGKIEIQNNVPFIVDQGTRAGLTLNDEQVTVHPLKPGDVIMMAQSRFILVVGGGRSIFKQENSEGTSNSSGGQANQDHFEDSSGTSFDWSSRSTSKSRSEMSGRSDETLALEVKPRTGGASNRGARTSFTSRSPVGKGATSVYTTASNSNSQKSKSSSSSNPSPEEVSNPPAAARPSSVTPTPPPLKARSNKLPQITEQDTSPLADRRGHQRESSLRDLDSSDSDDEKERPSKEREREKEKEKESREKDSRETPTRDLKGSKGEKNKGVHRDRD